MEPRIHRTGRIPGPGAELTPRSGGVCRWDRPAAGAGSAPGGSGHAAAAISTDHYTRLEQGRVQASEPVLDAINPRPGPGRGPARLRVRAGRQGARAPAPARREQGLQPQLRRLLDDLASLPAMVLGRQMDVLAWNPLAAALVGDFAQFPAEERNYARMVFSPAMRELYADWETTARTTVAQLRMEAAHNAGSPRLTTLVNDLSEQDPDFRRWWAAHHVAAHHRHQDPQPSDRLHPRPRMDLHRHHRPRPTTHHLDGRPRHPHPGGACGSSRRGRRGAGGRRGT